MYKKRMMLQLFEDGAGAGSGGQGGNAGTGNGSQGSAGNASGAHGTGIKIPTRREWYPCPYCGQHLLVYADTAVCSGLYVKCRKCRREVEIKIKN